MSLVEIQSVDADNAPWIGYIQTSFPSPSAGPGGLEIGTGSLIAPNLVLTAGHIVYDPEQGGQAVSVDVMFPGSQRRTYRTRQVDFPKEWRNPRNNLDSSVWSPVDVGILVLSEPIDRFITPMPFQTASDTMLTGMMLNVGGYPAFPPDGGARGTLYGGHANLLQGSALPAGWGGTAGFRLYYPINTFAGMSGGPLFNIDSASNVRTIRGIHTGFFDGFGGTALRINEDIFSLIQQWITTFRP